MLSYSSHFHSRYFSLLTTAFLSQHRQLYQHQLFQYSVSKKYQSALDLGHVGTVYPQKYTYLQKGGIAHQQGCVQCHQIPEHIQRNVHFCLTPTAHMSHQSSHHLLRIKPQRSHSEISTEKHLCSPDIKHVAHEQKNPETRWKYSYATLLQLLLSLQNPHSCFKHLFMTLLFMTICILISRFFQLLFYLCAKFAVINHTDIVLKIVLITNIPCPQTCKYIQKLVQSCLQCPHFWCQHACRNSESWKSTLTISEHAAGAQLVKALREICVNFFVTLSYPRKGGKKKVSIQTMSF